jgi:hypothetical protein
MSSCNGRSHSWKVHHHRDIVANAASLHLIISFFQGVRTSTVNACENRDPCLNGGQCLPADSGPVCDCSRVEFSGPSCEKGEESH